MLSIIDIVSIIGIISISITIIWAVISYRIEMKRFKDTMNRR